MLNREHGLDQFLLVFFFLTCKIGCEVLVGKGQMVVVFFDTSFLA